MSLIHADIFFVVATVGFALLAILGAIALVYLILLLRRLHRAAKTIEQEVRQASIETSEFFAQVSQSRIFSWLFGSRKSKRKSS